MSIEGLWLYDEQGKSIFVRYDEIDESILPKLLQPVGGFCYPVDMFSKLSLPPTPFYIKDWLPKPGKMLVYGYAKAGKSFLMLQLARCIGSGEPFLGIPTTQGRVLYLQFEVGTSLLQKRILDVGRSYPNAFVGTTYAMRLDTKDGQEQLLRAVQAVEPDVFIIDPLNKVITGDENEGKDMKVILDFFDDVIGALGCSVVIAHHSGKDSARGSRGHSILEGYPDAVIEMKKIGKGKDATFHLTPKLLRHAELPPDAIDCQMTDFEFKNVGRLATVGEKVEEALRLAGTIKAEELICPEIGTRGSVYDALRRLVHQGQAQKSERGVYVWIGGEGGLTDPLDDVV